MTEQEMNKACEWLDTHILCMQDETRMFFIGQFRKAMKGISEDASELTWQDMARISDIIGHTARLTKDGFTRSPEEFFTEVLDTFNKARQ